MATTELVDRAEATAAELSAAAKRHFTEAERAARRAAEAAQDAAELYGARAAEAGREYAARANEAAHESAERLGSRAQHAAETIRHEATDLRDEVEELWEDPETRPWILGTAVGLALLGLALWLLRRRRRDDAYESTETEVPGWEEPQAAFGAEPDDGEAEEAPAEDDTEGADA